MGLLAIIMGIGVVVVQFVQWAIDSKRRRWLTLRVVGTVCAVAALVFTYKAQQGAAAAQGRREERIEAQARTIAKLNRDLSNWATGGRSFCWVKLVPASASRTSFSVTALQKGDYPVYDITLQVIDPQRDLHLGGLRDATEELKEIRDTSYNVGTLPPQGWQHLYPIDFGTGSEGSCQYMEFHIRERNAMLNEVASARWITDRWKFFYSVGLWQDTRMFRWSQTSEGVVFESADDGYPAGKDGKPLPCPWP